MAYVVGRSVLTDGSTDSHGNPVESWADPVAVDVWWVAPRLSNEPAEPGRAPVVIGLQVGTKTPVFTARDRIAWPFPGGELYEVDGEPADWSNGPVYNWASGVITNLRRVEG